MIFASTHPNARSAPYDEHRPTARGHGSERSGKHRCHIRAGGARPDARPLDPPFPEVWAGGASPLVHRRRHEVAGVTPHPAGIRGGCRVTIPAVALNLDPEVLRPLIDAAVEAAVAKLAGCRLDAP